MNLIIILLCVLVFCLLMRGSDERRNSRRHGRNGPSRGDEQIERMKSRITVLEEILLDRDRQLRNKFRGL